MYHFIINPSASSGKGKTVWKRVESILQKENIIYKAHILQSAREVTELVRSQTSADGEDCHFVILGGDGTLNAVLNGIADFEHTVLSCIRTGSGNDFARNMGITKDIEKELLGILYHPQEILLDYGEMTYEPAEDNWSCVEEKAPIQNERKTDEGQKLQKRRFIISGGIGYDADICEEVGRSKLKKALNRIYLGKLVYVAIGVKQIFTRKCSGAELRMESVSEQNPKKARMKEYENRQREIRIHVPALFFIVGMIHEREGGGVPFCPNADPSDGYFDICLVKNMPKWKLLLAVILVYGKQHLRFRNITGYRCRRYEVWTDTPQWVHMDGETPCRICYLAVECKQGLRFQK